MLGAYSLLKVIELELQGYLSATKGRVGRCLALIQSASDVQEQGAVDDRDTFLHGVRDLLSIHSNAQAGLSTYVSAPGIVQQISGLHSDLMTLQSDLEIPFQRTEIDVSMNCKYRCHSNKHYVHSYPKFTATAIRIINNCTTNTDSSVLAMLVIEVHLKDCTISVIDGGK
ncbi:AUGMIN subunit 3 [Vitis vinifera]|uniref:AUGMIN subunit 3 n=1 Tax=Vitis vinifera TaxID=29760 RepID=A0A438HW42_VITVI|nr:AUGMIN subunit 3 [Vitis vinifera]